MLTHTPDPDYAARATEVVAAAITLFLAVGQTRPESAFGSSDYVLTYDHRSQRIEVGVRLSSGAVAPVEIISADPAHAFGSSLRPAGETNAVTH